LSYPGRRRKIHFFDSSGQGAVAGRGGIPKNNQNLGEGGKQKTHQRKESQKEAREKKM